MPRISVIMAAYRGAAFIAETLESVLAQSFADWELVIVDDCSPDDTVAVVRRFADPRIRLLLAPENGGPARARNIAMAAATGELVVGLDQDDIALPHRFAAQVAFLDAHPGCVLVAGGCDDLHGQRRRPRPAEPALAGAAMRWALHLRNPIVWSSVMFRADAARRLEPFERPEMLYAEDFDLYHRLARFGTLARTEEVETLYRVHAGGASKTFESRMFGSAARVLTAAYEPIFGSGDAAGLARLVVDHVGGGRPVADLASLDRLAVVLDRLATRFADGADAQEASAIAAETARIWRQLVRTAVRTGTLPPARALALRPGWSEPPAGEEPMLVSRLLGGGRRLLGRAAVG